MQSGCLSEKILLACDGFEYRKLGLSCETVVDGRRLAGSRCFGYYVAGELT